MPELRCGIVEVQFVDAAGQRWSLIDKSSIFAFSAEPTPDSVYPVKTTVACVIQGDVEVTAGDEIVTVSTSPDGVMTLEGKHTFTVNRSQLLP
ncbi:hypothetical protein [Streptomyces sp. NPDC001135]